MLILALDTSTAFVSVALSDGERVLARIDGTTPMVHGEQLAPAIRDAMAQADRPMSALTDVAVGVGPGPYTGLRVGLATALTLAQTLGLQAHGRCSLDIVAASVAPGEPFLVATDARRKEVYWARYDAQGKRTQGPSVDRPDELADLELPAYGPGAELYATVLGTPVDVAGPRADVLAAMVAEDRYESVPLQPLYLRRPDAVANLAFKPA